MTNKLSYMPKVCTGKVRFLDSADILFHFLRSGLPPYTAQLYSPQLSAISQRHAFVQTDPVRPVFLKNSLTSAIKRLATKKVFGPFKIHRAVVDSSRSVNLPFNIRKILCTYPRKRKDIRGLQMFQIGDLSSFLAGGLTCIRRGDLFVSWSGCREDQTP